MTLPVGGLPIGTLDRRVGRVRADGSVDLADELRAGVHGIGGGSSSPLRLSWWLGAGDRWIRPGDEVTLRQRDLVGTPVVETALRIAGGDLVVRVYGAAGSGSRGPSVVVEALNDTRVPLAFALVVARGDGSGDPLPISAAPDGAPMVGPLGVRCVVPPAGAVAAASVDALHDALGRGDPPAFAPGPGDRAVALMWPVTHGAGLRLGVAAGPGTLVPDGSHPASEQVSRGWVRQLDAACRVELPDDELASALRRDRCALLLDGPGSLRPLDAVALDRWGHHETAAAVLADVVTALEEASPHLDPAGVLDALTEHWRLTGDGAFAVAAAETVLLARRAIGSRPDPAAVRAVTGAAALLEAAGEPEAARALRGSIPAGDPAEPEPPGAEGPEARPALAVRDLLVDDATAGRLIVLGGWTAAWFGRPLELHGLPTAAGRLSLALRWHGRRPALLWDLVPFASGAAGPAPGPVASPDLVAPAFDARWEGQGNRGEALLDEMEPPPEHAPEPGAAPG